MAMSVAHIFGDVSYPDSRGIHGLFNIQILVVSRFLGYRDTLRDIGVDEALEGHGPGCGNLGELPALLFRGDGVEILDRASSLTTRYS